MLVAMLKLSTQMLQNLSDMLFPAACPLCGSILPAATSHADGCCGDCLKRIHTFPKHACASCGKPLPAALSPGPCGQCLQKPLPQLGTRSLYVYDGAVRDALLAWKLQGDSIALHWLITAASPALQQVFSRHDLLLPVPMPLARMRKSGLHHSADLCRAIAKQTGCTFDWQILRRSAAQQQHSLRQSALSGRARQRNLSKAFSLAADYRDKLNAHQPFSKIWVVDDILTTGATLRHACQTLHRAKLPVVAFSFARVIHK